MSEMWKKQEGAINAAFDEIRELNRSAPARANSVSQKPEQGEKPEPLPSSLGPIEKHLYQKQNDAEYLLGNLQSFASIMTDFLREGVNSKNRYSVPLKLPDGGEKQVNFNTHKNYQPNFLFKSLTQNIIIDLNLIKNSIHQHSRGDINPTNISQTQLTLLLSDALAKLSLEPLSENIEMPGVSDKPIVLTYLSHKVGIRLLPYCNGALIGVPNAGVYSNDKLEVDNDLANLQVRMSTDYMAIPHEIGHLFLRHGRLSEKHYNNLYNDREQKPRSKIIDRSLHALIEKDVFDNLFDKNADISNSLWLTEWIEELFADAFGCLIAGSASVLGFQNMLSNKLSGTHLYKSQKHPIPALRPLMQTRILEALGVGIKQSELDKLDDRWRNTAEFLWGIDDIEKHIFDIDGSKKFGGSILSQVQPIIERIAITLREIIGYRHRVVPTIEADDISVDVNSRFDSESILLDGEFIIDELGRISDVKICKNDSLELSWIRRELAKQQYIQIDYLVDKVLFNGWSDDGPDVGHDPG